MLSVLGDGCPALQLLNLNRCAVDVDGAQEDAPPTPLSAPLSSLPGAVDGGGMRGGEDSAGFDLERCVARSAPARLVRPLLQCASLTWLDVGWLPELLDDAAAQLLLGLLPQLAVLSLEGCKLLTDAALGPLWWSSTTQAAAVSSAVPDGELPQHAATATAAAAAAAAAALGVGKVAAFEAAAEAEAAAAAEAAAQLEADAAATAVPPCEGAVTGAPAVLVPTLTTTLEAESSADESDAEEAEVAAARVADPVVACGRHLVRLNCSWVDCISTACLKLTLRVTDARDRRLGRSPRGLQVLDYYGNAWSSRAVRGGTFDTSRDFEAVRCALTEPRLSQSRGRLLGASGSDRPLGWVSSWDNH